MSDLQSYDCYENRSRREQSGGQKIRKPVLEAGVAPETGDTGRARGFEVQWIRRHPAPHERVTRRLDPLAGGSLRLLRRGHSARISGIRSDKGVGGSTPDATAPAAGCRSAGGRGRAGSRAFSPRRPADSAGLGQADPVGSAAGPWARATQLPGPFGRISSTGRRGTVQSFGNRAASPESP